MNENGSTNMTNDKVTYEIHRRVGFRGAWEYLERHETLDAANSACGEYNHGAEPDYPAYKVVIGSAS